MNSQTRIKFLSFNLISFLQHKDKHYYVVFLFMDAIGVLNSLLQTDEYTYNDKLKYYVASITATVS